MLCNAVGSSRAIVAVFVSAVLLAGCGGSSSGSDSASEGQTEVTANGDAVSLSWLAPDRRINNDQLSYADIDGYIVRYGRDPSELDHQARVDCRSLNCGYEVQGLASGTWYFAVQTVDSNGLVSQPSQPVSQSI